MHLLLKIFRVITAGSLLMLFSALYPCIYRAAHDGNSKPTIYERIHQEPGTPLPAADEARIRTLLTQVGVNEQVRRIALFDNFLDKAAALPDPQDSGNGILIIIDTNFYKTASEQELTFVIGHEAGHIALGHLHWLNSLIYILIEALPRSTQARLIEYNADCFAARRFNAARGGLQFCARITNKPMPLIHPHAHPDNPHERTPLYTYTGQEIDDDASDLRYPHPITRARYLTPLLNE